MPARPYYLFFSPVKKSSLSPLFQMIIAMKAPGVPFSTLFFFFLLRSARLQASRYPSLFSSFARRCGTAWNWTLLLFFLSRRRALTHRTALSFLFPSLLTDLIRKREVYESVLFSPLRAAKDGRTIIFFPFFMEGREIRDVLFPSPFFSRRLKEESERRPSLLNLFSLSELLKISLFI